MREFVLWLIIIVGSGIVVILDIIMKGMLKMRKFVMIVMLCVVMVIMLSVIGCIANEESFPVQNYSGDDLGIKYKIIYIEDMPCVYLYNTGGGVSCDWSKFDGDIGE